MKPRKLSIKGLNSFREKQEVDFEKLTQNGFFGIFGPTGCGKSSILDAMTYALYGKISRDSTGFINANEDTAEVSYEFEIGKGRERKVYQIARAAKRDKKTKGYKTSVAILRELRGNESIIIADNKSEADKGIEDIIGLTMEDFTRAVVLPQGQFSKFLNSKPADRRDMLERIFALEKYGRGLGEKIKKQVRKNKEELDILKGKLSGFEEVSEENQAKLKKELLILLEEEKMLKEESINLQKRFDKYKNIWQLQEEKKLFNYKYSKYLLEEASIQSKKEELSKGKNALFVLPYISANENTINKLEKNNSELFQVTDELGNIEKTLLFSEKNYKQAAEEKNIDLPLLIEKKANSKRAIDLEIGLQAMEQDITKTREEYSKINKEMELQAISMQKLALEKKSQESEIEGIIKRLSMINLAPNFREKAKEGYIKELAFRDLNSKIALQDKKVHEINEILLTGKVDYTRVISLQQEKNTETRELEEKLAKHLSSTHVTQEQLFELSTSINDLKNKGREAQQLEKLRSEQEEKYKAAVKNKESINKYISDKTVELDKNLLAYKDIKEKISKVENDSMAYILSQGIKEGEPCPVCGSIHHEIKVSKGKSGELENLKRIEIELEGAINQLRDGLSKANREIEMIYAELSSLLLEIDKTSKETMETSISIFEKHSMQEKEFITLKLKLERWEKEKLELETITKKSIIEKGELDLKVAKLSERVRKDEESYISIIKDRENFQKDFDIALKTYEEIKAELNIEDFEKKAEEIKKWDIENQEMRIQEELLRKKTQNLQVQIQELTDKSTELLNLLSALKQSGIERRLVIDRRKEEIQSLSEGKEAKSYLADITDKIEVINTNEEKAKLLLEGFREEKSKKENERISLEKVIVAGKLTLIESRENLDDILKEYSFFGEKDARGSFIEKEKLLQMEKEIQTFDEEKLNIANNIKRLEDNLKGESILQEDWNNLIETKNAKESLLKEKLEERAKKDKTVKDMEDNILKLNELNDKNKNLCHRKDLLYELERLIQGNKLVEFVAMHQLKYVAAVASQRLKEITHERYALELDDTDGSFVMRDDFNGGLRRSTNSLSGGETFLTALSLSLALSTQIQLKGSASLEFFFLDEGFGTLDSELLDTVMNSLEKLRSDKLSVGIISHVDELKNRVPIKLIVTPAKLAEGTRVRIENS